MPNLAKRLQYPGRSTPRLPSAETLYSTEYIDEYQQNCHEVVEAVGTPGIALLRKVGIETKNANHSREEMVATFTAIVEHAPDETKRKLYGIAETGGKTLHTSKMHLDLLLPIKLQPNDLISLGGKRYYITRVIPTGEFLGQQGEFGIGLQEATK